MFVVFEGLDKAGKTTLEWELLKATNFKHVVIDRGPVGYKVFDEIFGRETKEGNKEFIKQAKMLMKKNRCIVVYCYCAEAIAKMRLEFHGEECPYDYAQAHETYLRNVNEYYKSERTLLLNTTCKSIKDCVKEIVNKLEEVRANEL